MDTSVVVAAFASWHDEHEPARRVLDDGARLIEHCALETYSVLTRLPSPHRAPGDLVLEFLRSRFPGPFLRLGPQEYKRFVQGLSGNGVAGGAAYDALVAATAAGFEAELFTCDRRAFPIYERYGVSARLIS